MDEQTPRERLIELESRRRERGIDLTVQVWYDDGGIRYNQPRIIHLKEEDRLFDALNGLVPSEAWGLLADVTGSVWYRRLLAAHPTSGNPWAAFDPYEAEELVDRREVSVRNWPNADIPTLLLQDIRRIEKMPPSYDPMAAPRAHLLAMSECLLRL